MKWAVAGLAVVAFLGFAAASWVFSNGIRDEVLTPRPYEPEADLQVLGSHQADHGAVEFDIL